MTLIKTRHLKQWPFVLLVTGNLLFIIMYLGNQLNLSQLPTAGWRRVDIELIQNKIQSGELSQHQAEWYRVIPAWGGSGDEHQQ